MFPFFWTLKYFFLDKKSLFILTPVWNKVFQVSGRGQSNRIINILPLFVSVDKTPKLSASWTYFLHERPPFLFLSKITSSKTI